MKKQQILLIHGGDTFNSYSQYLDFLKSFSLDLESLQPHKSWKHGLQEQLGPDFELLSPRMPNASNAQYAEWKLWFEKILSLLNDNLILIGHSLGGIFLAKYLAENKLDLKIKATILLAAPAKDIQNEPVASFALPSSLQLFQKQGGKIILMHSQDDPIVPIKHLKIYQEKLPTSETVMFEDKEHFNQEDFPQLVEKIKSLQ